VSSSTYSWQTLYQDALAEADPATKPERIRAAEDAISERRQELVSQGDFCAEVYAAEGALMRLWLQEIPSARAKSA